jgi:tripartite-type tricarboxylate transporter receptor subunit TctC
MFIVAIAALAAAISHAAAEDWPTRPIVMIVPTAAGGGTDVFGRILVPRLSEILGQQIVVENVGVSPIAASRVAKERPDGYHFLLATAATHAYSPSLYKNPLYDPVADFEPVILIAEQPLVLVTYNDFPANGLREFVAYAKAHEGTLKFGSGAGTGSANHLVCALVNSALGIKTIHVPYRDQGQTTQDLIAGRIDYQCPNTTVALPQIESRTIKAIAILTRDRSPILPDLASTHEQGRTDFESSIWYALFLPKGAPAAVVGKLHDAALATIETPWVRERLKDIGATVVSPARRSPEYLQKFVESEIAKWAVPIRAANITGE